MAPELKEDPAMQKVITFRGEVWELEGTGGGCTAYVRRDAKGNEWLITAAETADAPMPGEPAWISYYEVHAGGVDYVDHEEVIFLPEAAPEN